jgi:hypothetical protein
VMVKIQYSSIPYLHSSGFYQTICRFSPAMLTLRFVLETDDAVYNFS